MEARTIKVPHSTTEAKGIQVLLSFPSHILVSPFMLLSTLRPPPAPDLFRLAAHKETSSSSLQPFWITSSTKALFSDHSKLQVLKLLEKALEAGLMW